MNADPVGHRAYALAFDALLAAIDLPSIIEPLILKETQYCALHEDHTNIRSFALYDGTVVLGLSQRD